MIFQYIDEDLVEPKENSKEQQDIPRDHVANFQRKSTECGQLGHENMIKNVDLVVYFISA